MPELVELVESYVLTLLTEELSPSITRSATASSLRLRVVMYDDTSVAVARRGCRALCSRPDKRCFVFFSLRYSGFSPEYLSECLSSATILEYLHRFEIFFAVKGINNIF